VALVLIFVFVWAYLFWLPESVLDQRIGELKKEGIDVEVLVYAQFYDNITSTYPDVIFAKMENWSAFKQQVMTAKTEFGSVTVWVDDGEQILWFAWNETTYYYYEVP
jgi:hypothetical protein